MPTFRRTLGLMALCLASACSATSRADTWSPPKTLQVTSRDGNYRLTVVPSFGGSRAQVTKDASGKPVTPKAQGKLEKKAEGGEYRPVWEHPLTNDVSPVSALVANDGSVVTLDNWHWMGYGPNVVVLYGPDGRLVRSMGLDGFLSPEEEKLLPHSVSSIWWGRGHHIDETQGMLILNAGNGGLTKGDKDTPSKTVRVRLRTGEIIKEGAGGPKETASSTGSGARRAE